MKEVYGRQLEGYSFADLHMHTTGSMDVRGRGLLPHEAVIFAEKSGFAAIAITDHDNLSSASEAVEFSIKEGLLVQVIPGIEITTSEGHLLGLFLNSPIEKGSSMEDSIIQIHRQKGLAIGPHPFFSVLKSLSLNTISRILASTDPEVYLDGFELFNRGVRDVNARKPSFPATNLPAQKFYAENDKSLGCSNR